MWTIIKKAGNESLMRINTKIVLRVSMEIIGSEILSGKFRQVTTRINITLDYHDKKSLYRIIAPIPILPYLREQIEGVNS